MKSSVSPAVAAIAIVVALIAAGFFAYKSLATKSSASEDLTKNADFSKIMTMTDQEKEQMKRDFEKAKASRGEVTK